MISGACVQAAGRGSAMVASEALSGGPDSELLFATDIPDNVVKLKNVILNEFHVLRKFSLIRCNVCVTVNLSVPSISHDLKCIKQCAKN